MGKDNNGGKRYRGRGGKGRGNVRNHNKKSSQHKPPEMKFAPQYTKGLSAAFATVKDHAVEETQQTFPDGFDMADSLEAMQMKDLSVEQPVRKMSTEGNADEKKIQQDGFDILYQAEINRHVER